MITHTVVIHHSADFDGIFSREVARHFLGDDGVKYIGWDYGDPLPCVPPLNADGSPSVRLYMIDISIDGMMNYPGLIWIDHHKSAIEKYPSAIFGYRIDGVAACRLAWQYFSVGAHGDHPTCALPEKQAFIDRAVSEPLAVRLAGEYDIWDRRDPRAQLFQHGLRSQGLSENLWTLMLVVAEPEREGQQDAGTMTVEALLEQGSAVQYAQRQADASVVKHRSFTAGFEGLTFLCLNTARCNSLTFEAAVRPEHDALFGFFFNGRKWKCSLYHAPGKEHRDLSQIAVKYGGGGHRGACGFEVATMPEFQVLP